MDKRDQRFVTAINKAGFTLIELLAVVLIVGVLASGAVMEYGKVMEKSRMVEAISAVRAMKQAQESHYMATGVYTEDFSELDLVATDALENFYWETSLFSRGRFALNSKKKKYTILFPGENRIDGVDSNLLCCALTAEAETYCDLVGVKVNEPTCWFAYQIE